MEPFTTHTGTAVPMYLGNIDTDQIIPKKFLLRVGRTGFGEALFYDWRFSPDGEPIPDFVLNLPRYRGGSVLIAGPNFGCGSSREHAPWALQEFGFKVIAAPSFADIFYNNCFKTGILPAIVEEDVARRLAERAAGNAPLQLTFDLEDQRITAEDLGSFEFSIEASGKANLLSGMDEIALTLSREKLISQFESREASASSA